MSSRLITPGEYSPKHGQFVKESRRNRRKRERNAVKEKEIEESNRYYTDLFKRQHQLVGRKELEPYISGGEMDLGNIEDWSLTNTAIKWLNDSNIWPHRQENGKWIIISQDETSERSLKTIFKNGS
jgi:hypothetical protein